MPFREVLASGKVKELEILLWALSTHLFSALFYLLPSSYQIIVQNIGCFINGPLNEVVYLPEIFSVLTSEEIILPAGSQYLGQST